jgi:hypothetical protein
MNWRGINSTVAANDGQVQTLRRMLDAAGSAQMLRAKPDYARNRYRDPAKDVYTGSVVE